MTFTESVLDREIVPGAFERALLSHMRPACKASEASVMARYAELRG